MGDFAAPKLYPIAQRKLSRSHKDLYIKWNQLKFIGGDMNTSIIKTMIGRTIMEERKRTLL